MHVREGGLRLYAHTDSMGDDTCCSGMAYASLVAVLGTQSFEDDSLSVEQLPRQDLRRRKRCSIRYSVSPASALRCHAVMNSMSDA